jgi:hypothetical protein
MKRLIDGGLRGFGDPLDDFVIGDQHGPALLFTRQKGNEQKPGVLG